MDLITLSALGAAANTASDSGGGGGGVAERTDEHYANTVLLLHGDGNPGANNVNNPAPEAQYIALSDDSPNDRQLTPFSTGVYGTDFSPFYYNDGYFSTSHFSNGGFHFPHSADYNLGSGEFTIEFFMNADSLTGTQYICGQVGSGGAGSDTAVQVYISNSDGRLTLYMSHNAASIETPAASISANKWHFISCVRQDNTLRIYVDGVQKQSGAYSGTVLDSAGGFGIGQTGEYVGDGFKGHVSNFRFVVGSCLRDDGTTFTVPTSPLTSTGAETKILTSQSNRFKDNSPTGRDAVPQGTTMISTFSPFDVSDKENATIYPSANTGSIYMDGTSFVTVDNQAQDFTFGTEDWTIEFWAYANESSTSQVTLIGRNGTGAINWPYLYRAATNRQVKLYYGGDTVTSTKQLYPFEWTHIAFCREDGTTRVFMNGELQGSSTDTTDIVDPVRMVIGNNGGGSTSHNFNGYFHAVRVEKGRAKYTSNTSFNPATTAPAYANSVNTGIVSANSFSNFFDGAADSLANTNPISLNDFAFGINDWTIEGWFNKSKVGTASIYDGRPASGNGDYPMAFLNTSLKWHEGSSDRIASRSLSTGKWYHFAFVRSGSSTQLYLDGLKEADPYANDNTDYLGSQIKIGLDSHGNQPYFGWLHGLNVLNGVAKYTSNTAIPYTPVSKIGTTNTNGSFSRFIQAKNLKIAIPTTGLPMGAQHRTLEFWAKVNAYGSEATQYMVAYGVNGSGQVYSIALTDAGALRVVGYSLDYTTSATVPLKTWFHVSVNYDGTNNTVFLNGIRVDKRSHAINTGAHTHLYVNSDAAGGAGTYAFPSGIQICDLAVYNVAIRSTVLDSGFNPPTTATTIASNNNIVLLGCQSNTDIELANNVLSGGYDQSAISSETPFDDGYWSVHFDGSGDSIKATHATNFDIGGQVSVECWFRLQGAVNWGVLFCQETGDRFQLAVTNTNTLDVRWNGSQLGTPFSVTQDTWHHLLITRDSGNYVRQFLDGVLKNYNSDSNSLDTAYLVMGTNQAGNNPFNGLISNIRFINGSIPTDYATSETSAGTTVFTPSTVPFTTTSQGATASDVKLLTAVSGAMIDRSTANGSIGHFITVSGDARVSRSRPFSTELARDQVLLACQGIEPTEENSHLDTKFARTGDVTRSSFHPFDDGFWSGSFDGSDDRVTVVGGHNIGTGDFTISAWVYRKSNGTYPVILDTRSGDSDTKPVIYTDGTTLYYYTAGGIRITASSAINNGVWYFVRLVRSSGTTKLFLNGVQVGSDYSDSNNYAPTNDWEIGSRHTNEHYWPGYISNFHFTLSALSGTDVPTTPTSNTSNSAGNLLCLNTSNITDKSFSKLKLIETGANTRPVFPFANTTIPQQTTSLSGLYRGSIRNVGFLDESSNNTVLSISGTPTQGSFTPHYPPSGYWSVLFASEAITTPDHDGFDLGTNDFTIGVFVFPTGTLSSRTAIVCQGVSGYVPFIIAHDQILVSFNGSSWGLTIDYSSDLVPNKWQWLQIDRSGSNFTVSIDGVSVGTGSNAGSIMNAAAGLNVGSRSGQTAFAGYMSNLIMINGSTRGSTAAPTSPLSSTGAETKALLFQSNRFVDNGSVGHTLTVTSASKIQPFFPFDLTTSYDAYEHGGSVYFDGGTDYLIGPASSDFAPGTKDHMIEFWWYPNDGAAATFFNIETGGIIFYYDGAGTWYYSLRGGSAVVTASLTPTQFSWHHIVFSRSGTTGSIFYDGTRIGTATDSTNWTGTNPLQIGNISGLSNYDLNGYLAAYRWMNGSSAYDATSSTITVPTTPPRLNANTSHDANTKLLLNFTNGGVYDSTTKNELKLFGTTQISTGAANTKFGTGSIFFDGDSDYIETANSTANFQFGTGEFTIEFFVKILSKSGYATYYNHGYIGTNALLLQSNNNSSDIRIYLNNVAVFTTSEIPLNTWTHVAVTRDSSDFVRCFLDGRRSGAGATSTLDFNQGAELTLGQGSTSPPGNYLHGFMDEIRVTKGLARYTANFTPMTVASGNKSS